MSIKESNSTFKNVLSAERFFQQYGDLIKNLLAHHCTDQHMVEDVFQDFFMSLVARPIDPNIKNIEGYLYRATRNDIIDAVRKKRAYGNMIDTYSDKLKRKKVVDGQTPEAILLKVEQTEKLFDQIEENLTKSESETVTLRYRKGYDTVETALEMDVKKRSISRYSSIAIKKLRVFFSGQKDEYCND